MRKKVLAAVLATSMVAGVLAGCGSSSSSSSDSASTTAATTATTEAAAATTEAAAATTEAASTSSDGSAKNLKFAWWGNQTRTDRTNQALALYTQNYGTTFDAQPSDWDSYWSKLQTSAAGGSLPELIQMDYSYLQQYVDAGLLADLTPYVESGVLDTSNISDSIVDSGSVDGKLYAVCAGVNSPALLYNKELVEQAGVEIKDNMTLDEFEEVCKTMLEKTGTKADLPYGASDNFLPYLMRAQGVTELFNDTGLNATPDQLQVYFQVYQDGYEQGWIIGADVHSGLTSNSVEENPLVYYSSTDTQAWCAFFWTNQMEAMQNVADEKGFTVGITTWPSTDPVKSDFLKPGQFFSVAATAGDNMEEAVKVVNFLTNDIDANNILLGERGIPASSVVAEAIAPNTSETTQTVTDFVNNVVTPNSSTISPPIPTGANEVYSTCDTIIDKVLYGQEDSAAAAQELYDSAADIMSRQ